MPGGTGTGKLANDEILAVRDYLNDGGKLLYAGQNAAFAQVNAFLYNPLGRAAVLRTSGPRPANRRAACRCPTTSCSTGWARTATSTRRPGKHGGSALRCADRPFGGASG